VPEPVAALVIGLGLVALGYWRGRQHGVLTANADHQDEVRRWREQVEQLRDGGAAPGGARLAQARDS
jgi:hypothetical protein